MQLENIQNFKKFHTKYGVFYIRKNGDYSFDAASQKIETYDANDTGDITLVNSYDGFDYGKEITSVNGNRLSDLVDARPVVGTYTVAEGVRSPFEFFGRDFDDSSNSGARHSSKNVIASDESMTVAFNYYLPRADRLYAVSYTHLTLPTSDLV